MITPRKSRLHFLNFTSMYVSVALFMFHNFLCLLQCWAIMACLKMNQPVSELAPPTGLLDIQCCLPLHPLLVDSQHYHNDSSRSIPVHADWTQGHSTKHGSMVIKSQPRLIWGGWCLLVRTRHASKHFI